MKKKPFRQDLRLYKRVFTYVYVHWKAFVLAVLGGVTYSGIDSALAYFMKPLLDEGFVNQNITFIRWVPIVIIIGFLLRALSNFISNYFMMWVGSSVVMKLRQQIFEHLIRLPGVFYDTVSCSSLISKLLYDVQQVMKISTDAVTEFVQASFLILGLITVMFTISWRLTLLYLVTAPIIVLIIQYSNNRIRRISRSLQQTMAEITKAAKESIEGFKVVRIFGGAQYETNKFKKVINTGRQRDMKVITTRALSVSSVQCILVGGISFVIYLAIMPTSFFHLSAGSFVALMVAMFGLLRPLKLLMKINTVIQRGLAGAESVFALLDKTPEIDNGTQTLKRASGAIVYKNVSFSYGTDSFDITDAESELVLKNINLSIEPGQTVAFVGESGAGKTTLVNLLPRFYDVAAGTIYLDGMPIQELRLANLRQQMALVSQHVVLFDDTVMRNIAYGCGDHINEKEVIRAAEMAHALEFIRELPKGFNTVIGEDGTLLSGGQRQRLAIARAILKDAPILILDEATSALDTKSEQYIQTALEELTSRCTTLVIAHRLSTVQHADLIVVLDEGRVVEFGTHADLLALNGYYAQLYSLQFQAPISPQVIAADPVV